ncbi:MAG: class I SAM-dependent methyltransferase, partial [Myxococcota bacterium]
MSFSSEWLALREPYDHKARSRSILSRAMRWPMTKAVDLGAGTGSTLRALTPHIPAGTRWTLVDNSSDLLNALPVEGERLELDLSRELPPFGPECLVTASAFFDLVSEAWIERLVPALDGAALYSALDVDGRHEIAPAHDDDSWVFDGFRAHQTGTDKGFGVA